MTAFDLDAMCRDMMALNDANAAMYRRMRGPTRPLADSDEVPGGDDHEERAHAIRQTGDGS